MLDTYGVLSMVKHRIRGKHRSILDFLNTHTSPAEKNREKTDIEKDTRTTQSTNGFKASPHSFSHGIRVQKSIDDLLKTMIEKKKEITGFENEKEKKTRKEIAIKEDLSIIPTGKILEEILYKGLSDKEIISCNNNGECNDGRRVGEIFEDKYGFRRQRGFVNTTRLPIFLDWIVEEAVIEEILPKTYVVKTNRGSLALIPEDYLCELHTRYGVIIKNYDKCRKYKPSIGSETTKKRRR